MKSCLCSPLRTATESKIQKQMYQFRKVAYLLLLYHLITEIMDISSVSGTCSDSWIESGRFCYKKLNVSMPNTTAAALAACALEKGVFPTLRSPADFEAFMKLVTKLDKSAPFRIPLALRKLKGSEFYWTDSGVRLSVNDSYWGDGQRTSDTAKCVSVSTFDQYRLHDYDCDLPANVVCQRGVIDSSLSTVPCNELRRCIFEDGSHYTDTDPFACNSSATNRQIGPAIRLGFVANVFREGITQPLYAFQIPAGLSTAGSSSGTFILACNSTQMEYLTQNGYWLSKIVGFFPNISSTQDAVMRYLYWKRRPPIDSVLVMESERIQYEAQGVWNLVDKVYTYGTRVTDEECSVAINCQWSQWAPWSACSQSCDGGYRTRNRTILVAASGGGTCQGNATEINQTPCSEDCPRDCVWNAWNAWSICSVTCNNGTWVRNRTVNAYSRGRGKNCSDSDRVETGICVMVPCPIDCDWSQWQPWSGCSQSCDGGYRIRQRNLTRQAAYGGNCEGNNADIDNNPCSEICPRDCEWNTWTEWSTCSVTCANGTWTRTRTVKEYSRGRGKNCSETDGYEPGICTMVPCPINCTWSNWTEWGPWPASCGPPVIRYRYRNISIEAKYGGKACEPPGSFVDSQIRALPACPPPNDTYVDPVSPSWRVAMQAMQSLGSSSVIGCSSASFLMSLVFRSFSIETTLHMGQEASLIIAHSLITVFGFRGQAKGFGDHVCMPASICLHYLFIVYFMFMVLEALQVYSILTNVVSTGGFTDRRTNFMLATVPPLGLVFPVAMLCQNLYVSKNSCWTNLGEPAIAFFVVGPLIVSYFAVAIMVEAVGVEDYYPPLPSFDPKKEQTANICRAGLMMKGPLAIFSYIFGSTAVYSQQPWMYTCAMPINICFGISNIIFHISANERVLAFVKEKFKCLRRKTEKPLSKEEILRNKQRYYQAAKERRAGNKQYVEQQKDGAGAMLADEVRDYKRKSQKRFNP